MSSCASFIFLFIFSFLTSFRVFAQDPTYRYHTCRDPKNSSGSSVFFSNLETLLSTLSSIDVSFTGFQKATVGEPPDRVTELYDCRGDISPQRCRNCLVFAAKEALIRCPYQRDVTLFYDECTLRYSDLIITSAQDPVYTHHYCTTMTMSRNSTYLTNLRALLSTLSSPNASYSTGFKNATVGQAPDRVTGLVNCRGDVLPEDCRRCVAFAVNETLIRCPDSKEVSLFYEECLLRYADRNILSTMTTLFRVIFYNPRNVTSNNVDRFTDLVLLTLNKAATEAVNSPKKFGTRKTNFTASENLYGLVQCTPDLTRQDCSRCLQEIIDLIPTEKFGARVITPSCSSRYELFPFYNEAAGRTPPPPRPGDYSVRINITRKGSSVRIIIAVVPITAILLLFIAVLIVWARRKKTIGVKKGETVPLAEDGDDITTAGSLQFDFKAIEAATSNFLPSNKLGQGGFGAVYKGTFPSGVQVAVKRLSKTSGQGEREFKNEVVVVAKLQHRNLVRLLGFCLEGEEKILVYEFLPNKSLDYFLFDYTMQRQLDWTQRYTIIRGIARGILYLHQDSRLTVIHRDLKASNILLDADMNPKVADFGMARIFGTNQTEANTEIVVGTYGYMSPEYAMYGQFSVKLDVYSFGVLVLEIVSGMKNSSLFQMDGSDDNLITYTWRLWSNGSPLEIVDPSFGGNYETNEITMCIHIALLSVQEDVSDRPSMSAVVQMLTTSSISLAVPRPPGFFCRSRHPSMDALALCSVDDASITTVVPR